MIAAILIGLVLAVVMGVVLFTRGRRDAPAQRMTLVTPAAPPRSRWERPGLRSPVDLPRPVQLVEQIDEAERRQLAAYRARLEHDDRDGCS